MGRYRRVVVGALIAPLVSVLTARLMAGAVGQLGLQYSLPVGVHTYLPVVDLVAMRGVVAAAVVLAVLGATLAAVWRRRSASEPRSGTAPAAVLLTVVLMQVVLFGSQLLVVHLVQGVPDPGRAVVLALVAQASIALAAAVATLVLARLPQWLWVPRWSVVISASPWRGAATPTVVGAAAYAPSSFRRRGPPAPLFA